MFCTPESMRSLAGLDHMATPIQADEFPHHTAGMVLKVQPEETLRDGSLLGGSDLLLVQA
jgi:hypothetical protein